MSGLVATGVVVRVRSTGAEFGMHAACADHLIATILEAYAEDGEAAPSALSADFPAVIIGPLFAPAAEWSCARNGCES